MWLYLGGVDRHALLYTRSQSNGPSKYGGLILWSCLIQRNGISTPLYGGPGGRVSFQLHRSNFCRVCSVTQAFAACTPSLQWPPLQLSAADTPSLQHSSLPRMRRHSSGHQLRSAAYLHRATIPLLPRIAPLPPRLVSPNVLTW